jgi:microcystin-dependent protein
MADVATQLNNVFTRDGLLGPLAPFRLVDGTAAAPGVTFNSELNMGMFREGPGTLGVAIGGNVVGRFQASGFSTPEGAAIGKNITVGGNSNITGNETVGGNAAILGNLAVSNAITNATGVPFAFVPTGTILDFAGPNVPGGYLLCNGQAVSRVTYVNLFNTIGGYWGAGDGVNTFNVPDLSRYVTIGSGGAAGSAGGPANNLGAKGGAETNILQVAHMPSHAHGVYDPQHYHGVPDPGHTHGIGDPGHVHATYRQGFWGSRNTGNVGWCSDDALSVVGTVGIETDLRGTGIWIGAALTGQNNTAWGVSNIQIYAAGSNAPFTNYPPAAVVTKIIKT